MSSKTCTLVYATRERQTLWSVPVPLDATIADVIACVRSSANREEIPWDSARVGIHGEIRERSTIPVDGDRIELYRPLLHDPRERRRQSVQRQRRRSARA